jgi:hypothetical protein
MIQKTLPVVLLGMIGLLVVRPACADQIYEINVNTTALQSTTGYLDFQFNPGSPTPSDAASASLFDFTSDGSLTAPAGDIGDVTGAFPGIVIINNTDVANDHAEGFVYGSFFDVFVDLDVPIFSGNAASGSSFLLTLLDDSFNPILTEDALVQVDLDTNGIATITNNSPNGEASISSVPEPDSIVLVAAGLLALFFQPDRTRTIGQSRLPRQS